MAEYAYVGPVAHSSGNGNLPIHRIVVHCTAGGSDEGSARGTAKYFQDPNATGSAHAITDANELVTCAYDTVICWHAPPNPHSLGIEIECSLANGGYHHWTLDSHQKKMHRAAKWVAEKCKLHGIPIRKLTVAQLQANPAVEGICGHVDVSNAFHQSSHTDPGPYFPWSQFIGYVQAEFDALTPASGDDMSDADVAKINAYTAEVSKYLSAHIDQTLAPAVDEIKTYTAACTTSVKDYVRQTDNEQAILDAVAANQVALIDALATVTNALNALAAALPPKV